MSRHPNPPLPPGPFDFRPDQRREFYDKGRDYLRDYSGGILFWRREQAVEHVRSLQLNVTALAVLEAVRGRCEGCPTSPVELPDPCLCSKGGEGPCELPVPPADAHEAALRRHEQAGLFTVSRDPKWPGVVTSTAPPWMMDVSLNTYCLLIARDISQLDLFRHSIRHTDDDGNPRP